MEEAISILVLSGNIGCGKTTLLNRVKVKIDRDYPDWLVNNEPGQDMPRVVFMEENVEDWSFFLEHFYIDPKHYVIDLQLKIMGHFFQVYETALRMYKAYQKDGKKRVLLVERSPHDSFHVFIKSNQQLMEPAEYKAISAISKLICKKPIWTDCCHMIVLQVSAEQCWKRSKQRNRFEEKPIALDYLEKLHKSYQRMITKMQDNQERRIKRCELIQDNGDKETDYIVSIMMKHLDITNRGLINL